MKRKILISIFIGFVIPTILISCYKNHSKIQIESDSTPITNVDREVYVDSIQCKYVDQGLDKAQVITSKMVSDSTFLRKVLDKLTVTEKEVTFHIPELTERGEEYAILTNGMILIYKDAPKTKEDAKAQIMVLNIIQQMNDLDLLANNKNLEYEEIRNYLDILENATNTYKSYKNSTNPKVKLQVNKLGNKLKSTQITIYPKLRKLFAEESRRRLWEENIEVTHSGRSITFTGYIYANNKNIKDSYEAIANVLSELRFSRINFKWNQYADDYTYYNINSPADGKIIE